VYRPPVTHKFPILKKFIIISALFFLGIQPIFSAEPDSEKLSDFYYRVQTAIQSQKIEEFMSLTVPEKEERTELNNFYQTFLNFKASLPIMQLAEEREDRMIIHVLLQGQNETAFQSWNFSIDQEGDQKLIRKANVVSSIDGLFHLKVSSAAIRLNNMQIKHQDMSVKFKDGH
jgi:hypothetical protein